MNQHTATGRPPVCHDTIEARDALTDGYFGLSPRREQRRWIAEHREHPRHRPHRLAAAERLLLRHSGMSDIDDQDPHRDHPTYVSHSSRVEVLVTSFGHLHGDPPKADVLVDVREHLRDPPTDPAFRELTGHDTAVMERVLSTPGANALINGVVTAAAVLLPAACRAGRLVRVAVGCAGDRHRSVVIADAVAARLALAGWGTEAEHLHIHQPVVAR